MPDYGASVADKAIASTSKKVHKVYQEAAKDLKRKLADFTAKHKVKQAEMTEKLKAGEITQAAYDSWMRGQVFIGKQWKSKLDQATEIMVNANAEAASIVKGGRLHVFAENYNHSAFDLEQKTKGVVSFNLCDEHTAARMIRQRPKMLPEWKIDEPKDYTWNRQKVQNSITQGIIQGESIDQITDRLVTNLATGNENRMRTFARTSMTGAQNAGRQASMEEAEDMGIKVKKRWLATLDNRTRDTHQELDGHEVPVNEPFEVDGMEIMFPGDPNAAPELVYNCRCTMIEVYEGIDRKSVRRDEDDNEVEDMTYREWKEWKENGQQPVSEEPKQEQQPEAPRAKEQEATEKIETADRLIEADHEREKEIDKELEQNRRDWYAEHNAGERIALEERNNARQMRLVDTDISRYDSITTPDEYQARKQELAAEVREANNQYYNRPPRPDPDDYPTEEAYQNAENQYYEQRDRDRDRHEAAERAYYDHTAYSWKDIEEAREAKAIGMDELERQKEEIAQRKKDHTAKLHDIEQKRTGLYSEKKEFGTTHVIDRMDDRNVAYNQPSRLETPRTDDEIIAAIAGGDMTEGSCASVAMCYIGQESGWDVEDFRGGVSRSIYASGCSGDIMRAVDARAGGGLIIEMGGGGSLSTGVKVLSQAEEGGEYLFRCGCHASIVRNNGGTMEYLELQSSRSNGWKRMGNKPSEIRETLKYRFGADYANKSDSIMMKTEHIANDERIPKLLGYLNTAASDQKRGAFGHER